MLARPRHQGQRPGDADRQLAGVGGLEGTGKRLDGRRDPGGEVAQQGLGGPRPGVAGGGGDHLSRQRRQAIEDGAGVVAAPDPDHEAPLRMQGTKVSGEGGGGGAVVSAVEQDQRCPVALDRLEAAGPLVPGDRSFRLRGYQAVPQQEGRGGQGQAGVGRVGSGPETIPPRAGRVRHLGAAARGPGADHTFRGRCVERHSPGFAVAADAPGDPGLVGIGGEQRTPGSRDAELVRGDLQDVLPQDVGVVDGDAGQYRELVVPGVGGVAAPPEADLENRVLHPGGREQVGGEPGKRLEFREAAEPLRVEAAGRVVQEGRRVRPLVGAEQLPVDLDAFPLAVQVGGGVEPGPAVPSDQRLEEAGDRALAVGPPDDYRAEVFLRIPEPPQQRPGAGQVVVQGTCRRAPPLPVGQGVEVFSGFRVFHLLSGQRPVTGEGGAASTAPGRSEGRPEPVPEIMPRRGGPQSEPVAVRRRRTVFRGASHTGSPNAFIERRPYPESVAVRRRRTVIEARHTLEVLTPS